ncbi:unnamed protein product [Phytomonas sp. EM1]|nr:unnamed protein product [Phytomonas sp. EM1]|eukprot:CCW63628.1 unnamed protein product [Phytomonas sp. isolate EM1]
MNPEMRFCNRAGNKKSSELSHDLCCKKSDGLFNQTQFGGKRTGGSGNDVRNSSNDMSYAYSFGECAQKCSSSQTLAHLQGSISSVSDSQILSDMSYNDCKVQRGHQPESDHMLNNVKNNVMSEKCDNESCAKYKGKVMSGRGVMKRQVHCSTFRKDGEARKGCDKSDMIREQVGKHDASSFGCRECYDEDGTSHMDEEDTLDSSELSANRHTPLVFMHNNEKLSEWIQPDLENGSSFSTDGCDIRAQYVKESKLLSGRQKTQITSGSYCVILPRAHGVNTKLLRTADIRQSSPTHFNLLSLSIKDVLKPSGFFPLQQHRSLLFDEAIKALEESLFQTVKLELHGMSAGGTYMVHRLPSLDVIDCQMGRKGVGQRALAVFKPRDEEIGQERNPHGNSRSDREGFMPGSGSRREVLAYCLDHDHFAGIPPTLEVSAVYCFDVSQKDTMCPNLSEMVAPSVSVGSLQLFVPDCIDAADVLPGKFLVKEVHALAIFDIRTLNSDRHGGNVLVSYEEDGDCKVKVPHLVPIDHSYVCPAGYEDPDYEWLSWPQSKVPFSTESLDYIRKLDASADADLVAASLSANGVDQMATTFPSQQPLPDSFESNPSSTTAQNVLHLRNKQWMIEELWVMSSPLQQRHTTPYAYEGSSHPNFPKYPKHNELPCDQRGAEDVRAAANTLYCATRLLQVAALEFGLTAYDIGNMCRRPRLTCPSLLEELIEGSLDEKTWETDRDMFEFLLVKRLEVAAASLVEK